MTEATAVAERLAQLRSWAALGAVIGGYWDRMCGLPQPERDSFWLWRIAGKVSHPEVAGLLSGWDRAAATVLGDADDFAVLHARFQRALPKMLRKHRPEYDDQFRDAVVEMLGYHHFREEGIDLHFIPEGLQPAPDMSGGRVVVECKSFHTSEDDRAYFRAEEIEARTAWPVFAFEQGNPFLAKVLKTGEEQVFPKFAVYPAGQYDRYLFANFSLDVVALAVEGHRRQDKLGFFRSLDDVLRRRWSIGLVAIEKYALQHRLA